MTKEDIEKLSIEELANYDSKELISEANFLKRYGRTQKDAKLAEKLVEAWSKAWDREFEERVKIPKITILPE